MIKILAIIGCFCLVGSRALDLASSSGILLEWLEKSEGEAKAGTVQNLIDTVVTSLVDANETHVVNELLDALQENNKEKRADDQAQQTINAGRLGHCCLGGKLTVSYHDKDITVPVYHSTQKDTHTGSRSCGFGGWGRCATATVSSNHQVYYTAKTLTVKVPLWTCGLENAVCCHGYVTVKKIPGGLAEVGKNNCIESKKALFTIIQLQLLERIGVNDFQVTPNQMDKILSAVDVFFNQNGITPEA